MRVRVPCPGYWIMEIPSLGRANPVMIGLHHRAPEHYSSARLTTLLLLPALSEGFIIMTVAQYLHACLLQLGYIILKPNKNVYKKTNPSK